MSRPGRGGDRVPQAARAADGQRRSQIAERRLAVCLRRLIADRLRPARDLPWISHRRSSRTERAQIRRPGDLPLLKQRFRLFVDQLIDESLGRQLEPVDH